MLCRASAVIVVWLGWGKRKHLVKGRKRTHAGLKMPGLGGPVVQSFL